MHHRKVGHIRPELLEVEWIGIAGHNIQPERPVSQHHQRRHAAYAEATDQGSCLEPKAWLPQ